MIKYNIDKSEVNLIYEPQSSMVISIYGWAYSDVSEEINIQLDTDAPYRVSMYKRDDVKSNFSDAKTVFTGFTVDVVLYEKLDNIAMSIKGTEDEKETVTIDACKKLQSKKYGRLSLSEIKNKKKTEHQATKKQLKKNKYVFMGKVDDKMHYNFDEVVYVKAFDEVVIRGWQVAIAGENDICFPELELDNKQFFNRPDVNQVFGITKDQKNGFEYRVKLNGSDHFAFFIKNDEIGKINVYLPKDSFDGGQKDVASILDKEIMSSYASKYGKDNIGYKLREKEMYFQEAITNSQSYEYKKEQYKATANKCDISIVSAVNSSDYLKKLMDWFLALNYEGAELVLAGDEDLLGKVAGDSVKTVISEEVNKEKLVVDAVKQVTGNKVLIMDQEDTFEAGFLGYVEDNLSDEYSYLYADYDLVYAGEHIIRVNRTKEFLEDENTRLALTACVFKKSIVGDADSFATIIQRLSANGKGIHCDKIFYHYNVVENTWNEEPTKAVAFYLTQYHITEENNKWWGEGFTEWKNVTRGYPMFEGHDQPRVPSDLGYYDLVEDRSAQYKQVELAKKFNVHGFCYYYYWFEGKRLLRKPLDQFVENPELDLPYCICWANETWSRRWDGNEQEILMQQVHNEKTDRDFIYDVIPMLKDERYIKVEGKPLLLIYRFELFPTPNKTIELWREICRKEGVGEIHIAIVQAFDAVDHRIYGADSSVEFPPHKMNAIPGIGINEEVANLNEEYTGQVFSYKRMVENMSVIQKRDYNLFPGSMLKWDNTARRLTASNAFHEFTPELYRRWLIKNHHYTRMYNKDNIMFINAWNEWAEGSYLEPDETYGDELLRVTSEVTKCK